MKETTSRFISVTAKTLLVVVTATAYVLAVAVGRLAVTWFTHCDDPSPFVAAALTIFIVGGAALLLVSRRARPEPHGLTYLLCFLVPICMTFTLSIPFIQDLMDNWKNVNEFTVMVTLAAFMFIGGYLVIGKLLGWLTCGLIRFLNKPTRRASSVILDPISEPARDAHGSSEGPE